MKTNRKIIYSVIAMVFWMGAIFFLSSQPAVESKEISGSLLSFITKVITRLFPSARSGGAIVGLHILIRKSAHFFAFFILACLVLHTLRKLGFKNYKVLMMTFLFCVVYAILDEYHQTFVPGRSGEVRDVFIDSAGALTGIVVYSLIGKFLKRRNVNREKED